MEERRRWRRVGLENEGGGGREEWRRGGRGGREEWRKRGEEEVEEGRFGE